MAKWELHTYYNEPVNGIRFNHGDPRQRMSGKEHTLNNPVGLCDSCSSCHKSFNRMDNDVEEFKFCPNCGELIEGIDETTKLFSSVIGKWI